MTEEFNLSEKRKEFKNEIQKQMPELTMFFSFLFRDIEKQDKEFIRLLKEEFGDFNEYYVKDFIKAINKLAGEDLENDK